MIVTAKILNIRLCYSEPAETFRRLTQKGYIMAEALLWIGIILTVIGWLALAWQASKRMVRKDEIEKFPNVRRTLQLRRNYCWLTITGGVVLVLVALMV